MNERGTDEKWSERWKKDRGGGGTTDSVEERGREKTVEMERKRMKVEQEEGEEK